MATGPNDELPDSVLVGLAGRALRRKPLVIVIVTVDDDLDAGLVEHTPQSPHRWIVAVGS